MTGWIINMIPHNMSYRKISQSLEGTRLGVKMRVLMCTALKFGRRFGTAAKVPEKFQSN